MLQNGRNKCPNQPFQNAECFASGSFSSLWQNILTIISFQLTRGGMHKRMYDDGICESHDTAGLRIYFPGGTDSSGPAHGCIPYINLVYSSVFARSLDDTYFD